MTEKYTLKPGFPKVPSLAVAVGRDSKGREIIGTIPFKANTVLQRCGKLYLVDAKGVQRRVGTDALDTQASQISVIEGQPLSEKQQAKMESELHADPLLGHKRKGETASVKHKRKLKPGEFKDGVFDWRDYD